jgi:hypothetical protein
MDLKIVIHGTEPTATLIDSETTKDFVSLLPLTLTMRGIAVTAAAVPPSATKRAILAATLA